MSKKDLDRDFTRVVLGLVEDGDKQNAGVRPEGGWCGFIEKIYDHEVHDGDLENVHAVCEDSDGNVIDSDDDPLFMDMGDYFSVFLHRGEGGMDCIGDFATLEEATAYRDGHATELLKSKGIANP